MPITEDITAIITLLVGIAAVLIPILLLLIWSSQRGGSRKLDEINRRLDQLAESLQEINLQQTANPAPPQGYQVQPEPTLDLVTEPVAASMDEPSPATERELSAEDFPEDDGESLDLDFPVDAEIAEKPAEEPTDAQISSEPAETEGGLDEGLGDFDLGDDFAVEEAEAATEDTFGDESGETDWSFEEEAQEEQAAPAAADMDPFTSAATAGIDEADEFSADFEFPDDQIAEDLSEPAADMDDFSFEEENGEDAFGMSTEEPPTEEPPAEEPPAEEPPAEEPPAEEPPGIVPLPANPDRPGVSMARCAACDHKLAYRETLSGKRARCPSCKSAFVLP